MKYLRYSQSLILKSFGAIFALVLTVVLNDILDENSFGQYSYITSVATFLSTLILFGSAKYIMAELPKEGSFEIFSFKLNDIRFINVVIFLSLLIIIVLSYYSGIKIFSSLDLKFMILMVCISYFLARNKINMSILRASNYPILSELPETILKPLFLIVIILIFNLNTTITVLITLLIVVFSTYFIGSNIIKKNISKSSNNKFSIKLNHELVSKSLIVFFITIITILNENLIIYIMPYFLSFEFVGYYKIFSQLALLLGFGMMAVNIPQAYVISKNILDKNHNMTDHLVNGLKFSFLYYLLLSFIYFSIGINLVETFFGKNLTLYMNLFYTMTVGQLLYVLIGPMGQILILSKKYKNALKSLILSLILSIIITVTLIDNYGFNGACYSYVINLSIVHCNFAFFAYKELKIKPSIYYILFKSNEKSL